MTNLTEYVSWYLHFVKRVYNVVLIEVITFTSCVVQQEMRLGKYHGRGTVYLNGKIYNQMWFN